MRIEIDQSGKLEQLDTHTVIAGANKNSQVIWISAGEKRKLAQKLRKTLIPRKDFFPILFAILIYILILKLKETPDVILIDEEYTGKNDVIKETLQKLFSSRFRKIISVRFGLIGKSSPAHCLAWKIHRNKNRLLAIVIKEKDIFRFWFDKPKSRT